MDAEFFSCYVLNQQKSWSLDEFSSQEFSIDDDSGVVIEKCKIPKPGYLKNQNKSKLMMRKSHICNTFINPNSKQKPKN